MLSWLRKLWQRPKTMCDVDFGEMTYMDDYWEGQEKFPPAGDAVEYFLKAGPDGPTLTNRTFLSRVCDEYAALEGRVRVLMQGLPADQRPVEPLRPSSLDIMQGAFETAQWELMLKDARDTMFVLRCMGAQPQEVMERY